MLGLMSVPAAVQAAEATLVTGRIVFRDGDRELGASELERRRWGHLSLELRRDWEVFSVRPDADGFFTFSGPPGTYRLEYVRIGEQAEFFPPHEVEVKATGTVACLGTLALSVGDPGQQGGKDAEGSLEVRDDCSQLGTALRKRGGVDGPVISAPVRPSPRERRPVSVMAALVGVRAEVDLASGPELAALRGGFVYPFDEDETTGTFLLTGSVMRVSGSFIDARWPAPAKGAPAAQSAWGGSLGAGYRIWAVEAQAFGGYLSGDGRGAHGALGGAALRLGTILFGLDARLEWYPTSGDRIATLGIDVSPVALLGALL
jgi:hypothetical protein